jgi:hypothetical protein
MARLNYYDPNAVKAFVLDILVENQELRADLKTAQSGRDYWMKECDKADGALSNIKANVSAALSILTTYDDARKSGIETGERDTDRTIADALAALKGGETK